jgi:acyl carrier protein
VKLMTDIKVLKTLPTLDLDGDDDMDLIPLIEDAFDLEFENNELTNLHTVGEVYQSVKRRYKTEDTFNAACTTAKSFRILRQFLKKHYRLQRPKPSTLLSSVPIQSLRNFRSAFKTETGLRIDTTFGYWQVGGALIVLLGLLYLWNPFHVFPLARTIWNVLAIVIGLSFSLFGDNLIGSRNPTLGELSKTLAARNFGRLVGESKITREAQLWDSFAQLISDFCGIEKSTIGPETTFFKGTTRSIEATS